MNFCEIHNKYLNFTCYETVHCTVSPKFTCEFGATCLLCFAQFTPLKICRTVVRQILYFIKTQNFFRRRGDYQSPLRYVILFCLYTLHLRPRGINLFALDGFICTNTHVILFLSLELFNLILSCFLLLSYTQKKKPSFLNFFSLLLKYYINYPNSICQEFFIYNYLYLKFPVHFPQ